MNEDILPLIRGCLANENTSWEIMYRECASVALKTLRNRFSSLTAEDHEDIVQNILIKIASGIRNFNGTTKYVLLDYIRTTTRREAVSFIRQTGRHKSHKSLNDPLSNDTDSETSLLDTLEDDSPGPDIIAELNDYYRRAAEQFSDMKDRQLWLYKAEGYKDQEISELLDIPMGTVASKYNRIKESLRRTLELALILLLCGRKLPWMTSL